MVLRGCLIVQWTSTWKDGRNPQVRREDKGNPEGDADTGDSQPSQRETFTPVGSVGVTRPVHPNPGTFGPWTTVGVHSAGDKG